MPKYVCLWFLSLFNNHRSFKWCQAPFKHFTDITALILRTWWGWDAIITPTLQTRWFRHRADKPWPEHTRDNWWIWALNPDSLVFHQQPRPVGRGDGHLDVRRIKCCNIQKGISQYISTSQMHTSFGSKILPFLGIYFYRNNRPNMKTFMQHWV